tara:strand:- start:2958 stop:3155 length:198 start_codon:yes stop_codon:yes gene_type:complete
VINMDKIDRLDFLYKEVAYAESKLQPQDTGHISTAISWMNHRIRETQEEIRSAQTPTDSYGRKKI